MKKHLSLLLALILVLGSFSSALASPLKGPQKLDTGNLVLEKDENEEVRVIVELIDNPAVTHGNGKYTDMPQSTRNRIQKDLLAAQEAVKNDLSRRGIEMDFINSFSVAFNGFSGLVKKHDIEAIKENSNVKNVYISNEYERPVVEPDMGSSHDMIGSNEIWGLDGYNGEKMVVAIVDTGIDPSHPDMKISEGIEVKINESDLNEKDLMGKRYSDKVPYGYNYFDMNNTIVDRSNSPHGMHVAGTVAANGRIKGVAPEAQLLAMKVFSNDPDFPSTYDDVYMKSIEEAIELGVDVVNMSLGASASFYNPNNAMDKQITNAREKGVLFSISAGNEAHVLGDIFPFVFEGHPDIGLVGSPSLNKDSISVASVENLKVQRNYIKYGEDKKAYAALAGHLDPGVELGEEPIEFVDAGLGSKEDFDNVDVKGKIALVIRGELAFTEKIENAEKAGAAGVIVYNGAGDEELISMMYPDNGKIPALFIGNKAGTELLALEDKKVEFPIGTTGADNPNAGKMSDFTSWGTTPSLELKPEITAPGGLIYSTLNGEAYGTMSGTSMAAPHLAGGTALILEYLNRNFEDLSNEEKTAFAKELLMNTADPIIETDNEYSPRLQGAGLMRVDKAINTPVTVISKDNEEAKVELKDFTNPLITMELQAKNHSEEDVEYNINTKVLTSNTEEGLILLDNVEIEGAKVGGDSNIRVPAGETKDFTITVDLSEATLNDNSFVEGFIYLDPVDKSDEEGKETNYPKLVVPYVGFYGDWAGENAPRVLDAQRFDLKSVWGLINPNGATAMINSDFSFVGYDYNVGYEGWENRVAISPENRDGNQDVLPVLNFMRNAEQVEFNIINERGRVVRKLYTADWVSKSYARNPNYYNIKSLWDGRVNGEVVEDGKYYYQVKAKPHYKDAKWQEWVVPVVVDTVAPEVTDIKYDTETGILTWSATDRGIGVSHFTFKFAYEDDNGREVEVNLTEEMDLLTPSNEVGEYELEIGSLEPFAHFDVIAHDYAGNTSMGRAYSVEKAFQLESPEPFDMFDEQKVVIAGKAPGYKTILAVITTDGKEPIEKEIKVDSITGRFNEIVSVETDGMFRIKVVDPAEINDDVNIEDLEGIVPNRVFFVDSTPPVILDSENTVTKSSRIDELSAEEVLNSSILLGGGRTVIFVEEGIGYAYDRNFLSGEILDRFNNAEETYVKLANGIFINKEGKVTKKLPAVKYFEDKLYTTIRLKVQENLGEVTVYANGEYVGTYGSLDLFDIKEFNDEIEFMLNLLPGTERVEVEIIDTAGHNTIEIIELNMDDIGNEELKINEVKDLKVNIDLKEKYNLPTKLNAILNNGLVKKLPVEWTVPEGVTIEDGKVTIAEKGEYIFTGTIDEEYYGGYEGINLVLTVIEEEPESEIYEVKFDIKNKDEETIENAEIVVKKGEEVMEPIEGKYELEAGEYTYTVTAEGYKEETDQFTVSNEAKTVEVTLEKEDEIVITTVENGKITTTSTRIEGVEVSYEDGILSVDIGEDIDWKEIVQDPNLELGADADTLYIGIHLERPSEEITHVLINDGTEDCVVELGKHSATTSTGRLYYFGVAKKTTEGEGEETTTTWETIIDDEPLTRTAKWYTVEDDEEILKFIEEFKVERLSK